MFHHHKDVNVPEEIVYIYCESNLEYYLIANEDDAVLAPRDESNPYQVNKIVFCTPSLNSNLPILFHVLCA